MSIRLDKNPVILYGVRPIALRQRVKRNIKRFPEDFMFQLSKSERDELVAICGRFKTLKHSSTLPYVFTEQEVGKGERKRYPSHP